VSVSCRQRRGFFLTHFEVEPLDFFVKALQIAFPFIVQWSSERREKCGHSQSGLIVFG